MGTFNYCKSDIVTVAYDCPDEKNEEQEIADFNFCSELIDNQHFDWYDLRVVSGYYEGFSILIEALFDNVEFYNERRLMNQEVTRIKKLLTAIVKNTNCRVIEPHWSPTWYHSINESIDAIRKAVAFEREMIEALPKIKDITVGSRWQRDLITPKRKAI